MNNEYRLADGSPRYGFLSEGHPPQQTGPASSVREEETAEAAARLGLDDMAAAIDRRLASSWADKEDPLVAAMRNEHPEELAAARALVKLHLGSQRQWRLKAQIVRDKQLASLMRRRRCSGSAVAIMFLRFGLLIALLMPPIYAVATSRDDIPQLVLAGAACIAAAFAGGRFLTVRSRVPVMPTLHGAWLTELREDIVNATLVAVLQNKRMDLDTRTEEAGQRGWKSIQTAAKAMDMLRADPPARS